MAMSTLGGRRRLVGWLQVALAALLALGVWAGATVLFTRPALKALVDLSPQARFSLEPATEELLATLRERGTAVEFHTIFAPLDAIAQDAGPYRSHVLHIERTLQDLTRDLLRQYAYLGGDTVTVQHHDLRREPGTVKEVLKNVADRRYNSVIVKVGKRSRTLSIDLDLADIDDPRQRQTPGPTSQQPAPPVLKDYKGEEAISTALKSLLAEGEPEVYVLANDANLNDPTSSSYSELMAALTDEGFAVKALDPARADRIPPGDNVVFAIFEPHYELPDRTAEMIVQLLRRGGRVFLCVPWQEIDSWNPSLDNLGKRLGFAIGPELVCHVIVDSDNPRNSVVAGNGVLNLQIVNMNPVHPVTRPLLVRRRYPLLKFGREIREVPGADFARVDRSFLRTGPGAWLDQRVSSSSSALHGPNDPSAYQSRCVGAVVDVDPEQAGGRPGHLVLLTALGFNNLGFQTNGDLALNIFNWLVERRELVGIRGKKYVAHKVELTPQQILRISWLLSAAVPGALLLLGIVVVWRRNR